jgi:uncharacterized protein
MTIALPGAKAMTTASELSWATAFLAGLFGSTHCIAMCGGIAAALGGAQHTPPQAWRPILYQAGRLGSYGIAGAAAGTLGAGAGFAFAISRWSELLRLATAVVVIAIGLDMSFASSARAGWLRAPERWGAALWRRLAPGAQKRLPRSPAWRALTLGMLWGWLPCGLVYSVLVAAAVSGSARSGAATMIAFGLGTLPAMSGLSFLGQHLPRREGLMPRLLGAGLVACGLWTAILPLAVLSGASAHTHHEVSAGR